MIFKTRSKQGKLRTEGVITPSIPDIFPAYGRGPTSDMLEGLSRTSTSPDHLAGWLEIVSKDNPAKIVFQSYERRFWVQHYWRTLQQRYCDSLHRTKGKLTIAFADYFGVDKDTIKNDLRACLKIRIAAASRLLLSPLPGGRGLG